ncbi:Crp/Fnr family transcriptional regulator [Flavihumibacter petaseus]|uniref:Putative CRP/FNR family transcriptional regulator n=1 Tax=Flavihumibacter petaseus NBRC 106054 TaxID=1220578 RepID=A0A0E9N647_9BACT|nr:Crp/Fnr family transcriptional regulator [Flavihumibacter petaseus]GAO44830.1 putative CRP/FNR family transcriptional regulator [Flavihumibacter petaseus NBRC 106054]
MKSAKPCQLNNCFFCNGCLPEWKPAIDGHRKTIRFSKGETLFQEGDPVSGIFFVETGCVKVHKHWGSEKELILRFASNGDIIGHRGLGSETAFPVTATALEPTTACFIPIDFFLASLKVNHEFTLQLMLFYAKELQDSERKMRNLAHMPVKGRLAISLLLLQEKFGRDSEGALNLPIQQQDIASYIGTAYETLFRFMQEFIANGWIRKDGKKIYILDAAALAQTVDSLSA